MGLGLTPHKSPGQVTTIELLSKDSCLGLPLGLEAPVMTPNGVIFLFSSYGYMLDRHAHMQKHLSLPGWLEWA